MKFDQLDQQMRQFETASDRCVPPDVYMVARIDGRSFTRLTKEICEFEAPFDLRFRDAMVSTTQSLMCCGFDVAYAYIQSDEISLLFSFEETLFRRKIRKFNSILAGHASACFALQVGELTTFDCRVSQLPDAEDVVDYFRWRQQDAKRNSLNAHCYWAIRKSGDSGRTAHRKMVGLSVAQKRVLLQENFDVDFDSLPSWQKFGTAMYWEAYTKESTNPKSESSVAASRRRIKVDSDLEFVSDHSKFLRLFLSRD